MDLSDRKKYLANKLREAGTSGKKMHVIARAGRWIIINEASNRAVGVYKLKQQAIRKAKLLLTSGETEVVIFHNKDGSIARKPNSDIPEVQYAIAQ